MRKNTFYILKKSQKFQKNSKNQKIQGGGYCKKVAEGDGGGGKGGWGNPQASPFAPFNPRSSSVPMPKIVSVTLSGRTKDFIVLPFSH